MNHAPILLSAAMLFLTSLTNSAMGIHSQTPQDTKVIQPLSDDDNDVDDKDVDDKDVDDKDVGDSESDPDNDDGNDDSLRAKLSLAV
jgi:hypothetical protein